MSKSDKTEDYVKDFRNKWGDTYDYSKFVYNGWDKKSSIICKIHGEFKQIPYNHLRHGCRLCGTMIAKSKKLCVKEDVIDSFNSVHLFQYDYSKFSYTKAKIHSVVTCYLHGDFKITPDNHKCGSGCKYCAKLNKPLRSDLYKRGGCVYLAEIKIGGKVFYKIGLTNTLTKRLNTIKYSHDQIEYAKSICSVEFSNEKELQFIEKNVLWSFRRSLKFPNIKIKGVSEFFECITQEDFLTSVNCQKIKMKDSLYKINQFSHGLAGIKVRSFGK